MKTIALLADKLEDRARDLFAQNAKTFEARRFKNGHFNNTAVEQNALRARVLLDIVADIRSAIAEAA